MRAWNGLAYGNISVKDGHVTVTHWVRRKSYPITGSTKAKVDGVQKWHKPRVHLTISGDGWAHVVTFRSGRRAARFAAEINRLAELNERGAV